MRIYRIQKSTTTIASHQVMYVHEAFLAINIGLAITAITFAMKISLLVTPLIKMEIYLNHMLHIKQWDFIRGYFAFYLPALIISALIWSLLRLSSRAKLTDQFLFWIAGPLILLAMPSYWLYLATKYSYWGLYGSEIWRLGLSPFEPIVATTIIFAYLFLRQKISLWPLVPLFALHFLFWTMPIHAVSFGPLGLVAPIAGFGASVAWAFYICRRV